MDEADSTFACLVELEHYTSWTSLSLAGLLNSRVTCCPAFTATNSTSSTRVSPPLDSTTLLGYVPAPTGCKVTLKMFKGAPSADGAGDLLMLGICSAERLGDFEPFLVSAGADAAGPLVVVAGAAVASGLGIVLRCRVKDSATSIRLLFFSTVKLAEALMVSPAKSSLF